MQNPAPTTPPSNPYQRAATTLFVVGLISLGASNMISSLALGTLTALDAILFVGILTMWGAAFFTRRHSLLALQIGIGAFLIGSILSLVQSVMQRAALGEALGNSGFLGIMGLNIIYIIIVVSILVKAHAAICQQKAGEQKL